MGTMSVDFMVMGGTAVDLAERVLTMCFTRIEMDDPSKRGFDA
jgi:hypothetical protein